MEFQPQKCGFDWFKQQSSIGFWLIDISERLVS
jgi:hypothetical protein